MATIARPRRFTIKANVYKWNPDGIKEVEHDDGSITVEHGIWEFVSSSKGQSAILGPYDARRDFTVTISMPLKDPGHYAIELLLERSTIFPTSGLADIKEKTCRWTRGYEVVQGSNGQNTPEGNGWIER